MIYTIDITNITIFAYMKLFCLLFLSVSLALNSSVVKPDSELIRNAVIAQIEEYPESTLVDIYKNFFQGKFGPGHLLGGEGKLVSARAYLMKECEVASEEENLCPDCEEVGLEGRYLRVNLNLIGADGIPFDAFFDAFARSAGSKVVPDVKQWRKEWKSIVSVIRKMKLDLPDFDRDRKAIDRMLSQGEYVMHHSRAFTDAYHPHYRLITKEIFEKELRPYIDDVR